MAKLCGRNVDRAGWAEAGLQAFCEQTGQDMSEGVDGPEEVISDFLCDLMHVCHEKDLDFDGLLARGRRHFEEETDSKCTKCGGLYCGFDEGDPDTGRCSDCEEESE